MAASLASFSGGWFADKFSRKRTIALGAALFCVGAALEAGSEALAMFIVGRLLAGGEKTLISPIHEDVATEILANVAGEGLFLSATGGKSMPSLVELDGVLTILCQSTSSRFLPPKVNAVEVVAS